MGIRVKQLPEYGLTLNIWSGTVTRDDLIGHYAGLTPEVAGRRIAYLDPTVDLSGVEVTAIPELRRTVTGKFRELYGDGPVLSAFVCPPGVNRPLLDFWLRYAGEAGEHAGGPVVLSSLEEACDWLGLPHQARGAVVRAIDG